MTDSWRVRRLLTPWCALRGHRERFWMQRRINGAPFEDLSLCSCGGIARRYPIATW